VCFKGFFNEFCCIKKGGESLPLVAILSLIAVCCHQLSRGVTGGTGLFGTITDIGFIHAIQNTAVGLNMRFGGITQVLLVAAQTGAGI
jgi:predicted ATP-dependent Lon-type protease